jgi:hypothetical protein
MKLRLRLSTFVLVLLVLLAGCGHKPPVGSELRHPTIKNGVWETAWVDPKIVRSDSVLTLFQASRIDSIQVEPTTKAAPSAAVEFHITDPVCDVKISLLDGRSQPVRELLATTLVAGHYKVSLNPGSAKRLVILPGKYRLQVISCGQPVARLVSVS